MNIFCFIVGLSNIVYAFSSHNMFNFFIGTIVVFVSLVFYLSWYLDNKPKKLKK